MSIKKVDKIIWESVWLIEKKKNMRRRMVAIDWEEEVSEEITLF